jgi:glycosyltransferase involved in cell wall biosynthesis
VIVLDDNSEDDTFSICREYAMRDSRIRVLKGEPLRDDWLGKNFACHQLAAAAGGRFLMFLDADEEIAEGLINNTVHRMKYYRLNLLSLFTDQVMISPGERMIVPLMHFILLNLLPLRLVRLSSNPSFAAASGQFMMFDAATYKEQQWHEQVKGKIVEDIEIMKLVKGYGYRAEALLANGYISCRMYRSFAQAFAGFSKNILAGFNHNVLVMFLYLLFVVLGPLAIFYFLPYELLFFALTLIGLSRVMISLMARQNVLLNLVLHPFQLFCLVLIAVTSMNRYFTNTTVWKGRHIRIKK